MLNKELLDKRSAGKQNPEFATTLQELDLAHSYASKMHRDGRLTKSELADFEAHLYAKLIDEMPVDAFQQAMHDGSLHKLQALAGHEDGREDDVAEARAAVERKIKADALDDAWVNQKITSEYYADQCQQLGASDAQKDRIADGDHDSAASEFFAERNDAAPAHETDLQTYMRTHYGKGSKPDKPPGEVVRHGTSREIDKYLTDTYGDDKKQGQIVDLDAVPAEQAEESEA